MTDRLLQIFMERVLGDCTLQKNSSKNIGKYILKSFQPERHGGYVGHLHREFPKFWQIISPHVIPSICDKLPVKRGVELMT